MRLLTGTSGFSYREWKGIFYPEDLPASGMLRYYAERFDTVEINNTFYRAPSESVLNRWADAVPAGFRFALKAPRQITHRRKLEDAGEEVEHFLNVIRGLDEHLGPVLFQLPPSLRKDLPRLESFLDVVPTTAPIAFEFRHPSWFEDDVFAALRDRNAALCIAHAEGLITPTVATANWGYLRLRQVNYDDATLKSWVETIRSLAWSEAYVYFKHEDAATGPRLAKRFGELFRSPPA